MSQYINRIDEIIERVSKMSKWDLKTSLVNHELACMDAQSRIKMLEAEKENYRLMLANLVEGIDTIKFNVSDWITIMPQMSEARAALSDKKN